MRILVLGAGVLGSLYAARLHDAGHDVTILARGDRLASIRRHGVVVRDDATGLVSTSLVPVIDRLGPTDRYDVALVLVRREQRAATLPVLAANATPTVLFMGDDPSGAGDLVAGLGGERVLLGLPAAGGSIEEGVVHARVAGRREATTIGELDGHESDRVRELVIVLRSAGFPTVVSHRIDAVLKSHAVVVVPVAAAVYAAGGDVGRAARTPDLVILVVRAIREGVAVLRALDVPVTPDAYGRAIALPEPILRAVVGRALASDRARLLTAAHALHARTEMAALAEDIRTFAERSGVPTPSLDRLIAHVDPTAEPIEDGSRTLVVRHPARAATFAGATAIVGLSIGMLVLRRFRPDLLARAPAALRVAPSLPATLRSAVQLPAVRFPPARMPAVRFPPARMPAVRLPAVRVPEIGAVGIPRPVIERLRSLGRLSILPSAALLASLAPMTTGSAAPGPEAPRPGRYDVLRAWRRFRRPGFWPYRRTPAE